MCECALFWGNVGDGEYLCIHVSFIFNNLRMQGHYHVLIITAACNTIQNKILVNSFGFNLHMHLYCSNRFFVHVIYKADDQYDQ